MKRKHKILSVVTVLLFTLILVACGGNKPVIKHTYTDGFIEEFTIVDTFVEEANIVLPDGMSFWMVYDNGSYEQYQILDKRVVTKELETTGLHIRNIEVSEETANTRLLEIEIDNNGVGFKTEFRQFLNTGVDEDLGLAINYDIRTLTHNQGYSFDASGSEVYLISANGASSLLDNTNVTFKNSDYHPRGSEAGKEYLNNVSILIEPVLSDNEDITAQDFSVVIAGGEKPMHSKTSSFWNWVFLQTPIAFLASFIGSITGNSFVWAIILTTIIVRTLAWPIYAKTNDMSFKMNIAQPEMQKIQDKYATRKDPESQQKMQMELMGVYKKHGINMLGCLMPILQMPIFLAMFQVVRRITIPGGQFYLNVQNSNFLGIDLSSTSTTIANFIFAGLVGLTMYILQKLSAKKPSYSKSAPKTNNPQAAQSEQTMKMVSFFMIIMMVFASFATISLAFYWIIGNLYSIGQTLLNRHLAEVKYKKLEEEKLYGKGYKSSNVIDATFKEKGDK